MSYSVKTEQGTRFFKTKNEAREYVRGILEQTDGGAYDIVCADGCIAESLGKTTLPDGSVCNAYYFHTGGFNSSAIRCCTIVFGQDAPYSPEWDPQHPYNQQIFSDAEVNSDFKCGRYVLKGELGEFGWFDSIENARIIAVQSVMLAGAPYVGTYQILDKVTGEVVESCGYVGGKPMSVVDGVGYRCTPNGTLARGKTYRVVRTDRPKEVTA